MAYNVLVMGVFPCWVIMNKFKKRIIYLLEHSHSMGMETDVCQTWSQTSAELTTCDQGIPIQPNSNNAQARPRVLTPPKMHVFFLKRRRQLLQHGLASLNMILIFFI
jgi:hypothetical protein